MLFLEKGSSYYVSQIVGYDPSKMGEMTQICVLWSFAKKNGGY